MTDAFPSFFRHFLLPGSDALELLLRKPISKFMKAIRHISMLIMTLIMSLLPLSVAAGDTDTSHTVTMQQQPKPTKNHNPEIEKNCHRSPARPVLA